MPAKRAGGASRKNVTANEARPSRATAPFAVIDDAPSPPCAQPRARGRSCPLGATLPRRPARYFSSTPLASTNRTIRPEPATGMARRRTAHRSRPPGESDVSKMKRHAGGNAGGEPTAGARGRPATPARRAFHGPAAKRRTACVRCAARRVPPERCFRTVTAARRRRAAAQAATPASSNSRSTGQPRAAAIAASRASGFVATGSVTRSSSGASLIESL